MDHRTTTCLAITVAIFTATISVTAQTPALAITHVSVVDVVNGRIIPNSTVTIRGGTIAGITQDNTRPTGSRMVDGSGKFLIPGLWDMHAHMEAAGESWLQ